MSLVADLVAAGARAGPGAAAGYAMIPLALGGLGSIVSGFLPLSLPRKWVASSGYSATAILIPSFQYARWPCRWR